MGKISEAIKRVGDWIGNAIQIGAIAENPSVMTAAGFHVDSDTGKVYLELTEEDKKLANNLALIGAAGAAGILTAAAVPAATTEISRWPGYVAKTMSGWLTAYPYLFYGADAALTAKGFDNLVGPDGYAKTKRLYNEGDYAGAVKSAAVDILDALPAIPALAIGGQKIASSLGRGKNAIKTFGDDIAKGVGNAVSDSMGQVSAGYRPSAATGKSVDEIRPVVGSQSWVDDTDALVNNYIGEDFVRKRNINFTYKDGNPKSIDVLGDGNKYTILGSLPLNLAEITSLSIDLERLLKSILGSPYEAELRRGINEIYNKAKNTNPIIISNYTDEGLTKFPYAGVNVGGDISKSYLNLEKIKKQWTISIHELNHGIEANIKKLFASYGQPNPYLLYDDLALYMRSLEGRDGILSTNHLSYTPGELRSSVKEAQTFFIHHYDKLSPNGKRAQLITDDVIDSVFGPERIQPRISSISDLLPRLNGYGKDYRQAILFDPKLEADFRRLIKTAPAVIPFIIGSRKEKDNVPLQKFGGKLNYLNYL